MAKRKISISIRGLLDLENKTITEYDKKTETEIVHNLDDLFLPFNSLEDINISLSYDSEIIPE